MSPSKQRYRQAVHAARDFVSGKLSKMPDWFDERQVRIYNLNVAKEKIRFDNCKSIMDDMYIAYTGRTMDEYHKGEK